jgi:hypothetical protein
LPPELEMTFMSGSTIGIQLIMPKTRTSPNATPEQQASEREAATQPVAGAAASRNGQDRQGRVAGNPASKIYRRA